MSSTACRAGAHSTSYRSGSGPGAARPHESSPRPSLTRKPMDMVLRHVLEVGLGFVLRSRALASRHGRYRQAVNVGIQQGRPSIPAGPAPAARLTCATSCPPALAAGHRDNRVSAVRRDVRAGQGVAVLMGSQDHGHRQHAGYIRAAALAFGAQGLLAVGPRSGHFKGKADMALPQHPGRQSCSAAPHCSR